jgi:hypothetical protein
VNGQKNIGILRQRKQRILLLAGLAGLTIIFLGAAAYIFLGNPPGRSNSPQAAPVPLGEAPQALRLTVLETGIAIITSRQLSQSGLPVETISAETLQLTRDGQIVPFHIIRDSNDNSTLYFYAQAVTNTLEAPAVYWLAPGQGQEILEVDAAPDSTSAQSSGQRYKKWEENEIFLAQASGDDVWLGKLLFAPNSLDIPLDDIQPTGGPGLLTIQIWSNNQARPNPDHHVELFLNGEKLLDHFWEGIKQETITTTLSAEMLQPTGNVLTVNAPGDTGAAGEALYIDWVALNYEGFLETNGADLVFESSAGQIQVTGFTEESLMFDISDPNAPKLLYDLEYTGKMVTFRGNEESSRYLATMPNQATQPQISLVPFRQPLTAEDQGADYIAIVADMAGFEEVLQPLLDHREQQGMDVISVPLSQIFDEFGYGPSAACHGCSSSFCALPKSTIT